MYEFNYIRFLLLNTIVSFLLIFHVQATCQNPLNQHECKSGRLSRTVLNGWGYVWGVTSEGLRLRGLHLSVYLQLPYVRVIGYGAVFVLGLSEGLCPVSLCNEWYHVIRRVCPGSVSDETAAIDGDRLFMVTGGRTCIVALWKGMCEIP